MAAVQMSAFVLQAKKWLWRLLILIAAFLLYVRTSPDLWNG